MSNVIIDTNVMMVANRQHHDVTESCVSACIIFLARSRAESVVLLDSGDEIRAEYARALQQRRPYELGAQFLIHIYQQQSNPKRVRMVNLAKTPDGEFVDFPAVPELTAFDRSDRKFAALAKRTKTAVTNASDTDWMDHRAALKEHGIDVNFLCGVQKDEWFKK